MKGYVKIIVGIFAVTSAVTLSMFGAVYAGNWFLEAIEMSAARAKDILFLVLNACCGLMLALGTYGSFYWFLPLCWKEHKRRKQEAKAEKHAAEIAKTGGNRNEGKD